MVLELASAALHSWHASRFLNIAATVTAVTLLRRWSAGYLCQQERNIADRTFILVGACSGPGLELLRHLALRGAQVIVLHPTPADPAIFQVILLLRETTGNERIYADECDVMDVASIQAFAKRWGQDARKGMVSDLEANIEALVFCDGDGSGLEGAGMGIEKLNVSGSPTLELHHASLVLARHTLIQFLLPFLVRSSQTAPVRIIFQLSPFYAASPPLLPSPTAVLDFLPPFVYPKWQPWIAEGQASLASLALLRELQTRVAQGRKSDAAGIVTLAACGGFTRAWFRQTLRASAGHPRFSWIGFFLYLLWFPFIWTFAKSANEAAQDLLLAVLGSVTAEAPVVEVKEEGEVEQGEGKKVPKPDLLTTRKQLRPGALYREGTETRVVLLEAAGSKLGSTLWAEESKRVEQFVAEAVKAKKPEATSSAISSGTSEKSAKRD